MEDFSTLSDEDLQRIIDSGGEYDPFAATRNAMQGAGRAAGYASPSPQPSSEPDFSQMSDADLQRIIDSGGEWMPQQQTVQPAELRRPLTREERIAKNDAAIAKAMEWQPESAGDIAKDALVAGTKGAARAVKSGLNGLVVSPISGAVRLAGTVPRMLTGWDGLHRIADTIDQSYENWGADAIAADDDGWMNHIGEYVTGTAGSLGGLALGGGVAGGAAKLAGGGKVATAVAKNFLPAMFGNDAAVRTYDTAIQAAKDRGEEPNRAKALGLASVNGAIHFLGFKAFENQSLSKMLKMGEEVGAALPKIAKAAEKPAANTFSGLVDGTRNGLLKYVLAERGKGALRAGGIMGLQNFLSSLPQQAAEGGGIDLGRAVQEGLGGGGEGGAMEGLMALAGVMLSPRTAKNYITNTYFRNGYKLPNGQKAPGLLHSPEGRQFIMKQNPAAQERILDIVSHGGKVSPEELDTACLPPDMTTEEIKKFANDWMKDLEPQIEQAWNADAPKNVGNVGDGFFADMEMEQANADEGERRAGQMLSAEEAAVQQKELNDAAERRKIEGRGREESGEADATDEELAAFNEWNDLYRKGEVDISFDEWLAQSGGGRQPAQNRADVAVEAAGARGEAETGNEPSEAPKPLEGLETRPEESVAPVAEETIEARPETVQQETREERPNETGNVRDEAQPEPEPGAEGRPAAEEAARPVAGAETRAEAPDAGVVEPPREAEANGGEVAEKPAEPSKTDESRQKLTEAEPETATKTAKTEPSAKPDAKSTPVNLYVDNEDVANAYSELVDANFDMKRAPSGSAGIASRNRYKEARAKLALLFKGASTDDLLETFNGTVGGRPPTARKGWLDFFGQDMSTFGTLITEELESRGYKYNRKTGDMDAPEATQDQTNIPKQKNSPEPVKGNRLRPAKKSEAQTAQATQEEKPLQDAAQETQAAQEPAQEAKPTAQGVQTAKGAAQEMAQATQEQQTEPDKPKGMSPTVKKNRLAKVKSIIDMDDNRRTGEPFNVDRFRKGNQLGMNPNGLSLPELKDLYENDGWHREFGLPEADAEALRDAVRKAYEYSYMGNVRGRKYRSAHDKLHHLERHPDSVQSLAMAHAEVAKAYDRAKQSGDSFGESLLERELMRLNEAVSALTPAKQRQFGKARDAIDKAITPMERKGRVSNTTAEGKDVDVAAAEAEAPIDETSDAARLGRITKRDDASEGGAPAPRGATGQGGSLKGNRYIRIDSVNGDEITATMMDAAGKKIGKPQKMSRAQWEMLSKASAGTGGADPANPQKGDMIRMSRQGEKETPEERNLRFATDENYQRWLKKNGWNDAEPLRDRYDGEQAESFGNVWRNVISGVNGVKYHNEEYKGAEDGRKNVRHSISSPDAAFDSDFEAARNDVGVRGRWIESLKRQIRGLNDYDEILRQRDISGRDEEVVKKRKEVRDELDRATKRLEALEQLEHNNGNESSSIRYLRAEDGRVVGTWNRETGELDLYRGASWKTLNHEFGHAVRQYAEQEAARGNRTLLDKIEKCIDEAPQAFKDEIRSRYAREDGESDAAYENRIRDEIWGAIREGRDSEVLQKAIKTLQGRAWYSRAWDAIKTAWRGILAKMGFNRADLSGIDKMTPDEFNEFLDRAMTEGKTLGRLEKEGGREENTREARSPRPAGYAILDDVRTTGDKAREKFLDSDAPIKDFQDEVGGVEEKVDADGYTDWRNSTDVVAAKRKANGRVEYKMRDLGHRAEKMESELLKARLDKQKTSDLLADFNLFTQCEHAPERNRTIAERNGVTYDDTYSYGMGEIEWNGRRVGLSERLVNDEILPWLQNKYGAKFSHFADAAKELYEINREDVRNRVASGRLSPHDANFYLYRWSKYVPLKTDMEALEPGLINSSTAGMKRNEYMKAFGRGRGDIADSPVAASILQAEEGIRGSIRNEVSNVMANLIEHGTDARGFKDANGNSLIGEIVEGITEPHLSKDYVFTFSDGDRAKGNAGMRLAEDRDDIFLFKRDGKLMAARIVKGANGRGIDILKSFKGDNIEKWGDGILSKIPKMTHWMSAMRTQYSPEFTVSNWLADSLEAAQALVGRYGVWDGSKAFAKTVASEVSNAKDLIAYLRHGELRGNVGKAIKAGLLTKGGIASEGFEGKETSIKSRIEELRRKADGFMHLKGMDRVKRAWEFGRDFLSVANEFMEYSTRCGLFTALHEKGVPIEKAVDFARGATVDFNRKGTLMPIINGLYMFANASVQGAARAVQAGKESFQGLPNDGSGWGKHKVKGDLVALLVTIGAAQAVLDHFIGNDEDREKAGGRNARNRTEYDRKHNVGIPLPGGYNAPLLRFRGPYAAVPYIAQNTMRTILGDAKPSDVAWTFAREGADQAFDLVGGNGMFNDKNELDWSLLGQSLAPSMIDPVIQLASGKDYKGDNRLRRSFDEKQPKSWNGKPNTPWGYKKFAQVVNEIGGNSLRKGKFDFAPEDAQLVVEFLGGGLLRDLGNAVSTAQNIYHKATGGNADRLLQDFPLGRRLVREYPENTSRYYDAIDAYERDKAEYKKTTDLKGRAELKKGKPYLSSAKTHLDGMIDRVKELTHLERGEVKHGQKWVEPKTQRSEAQKEAYRKRRLELQARVLKRLGG